MSQNTFLLTRYENFRFNGYLVVSLAKNSWAEQNDKCKYLSVNLQ